MLSSTFIDELGYLALDQQTSNLFYQVISTRQLLKRLARLDLLVVD